MTNNSSLQTPTNFKIEIAMESDWHIGSGIGRRGDIDRLVKRDRDGLPYLPAKTITGIWRDACELLVNGLDDDSSNGHFSKLLDYLFGDQPALSKKAIAISPREAALSIRAAHFPETLSKALKNKPLLKEAIAFVKAGVKIDRETGCAIEEYLRFEEVVRGGITLSADCQLQLPVDAQLQQLCFALLVASTKFFTKIGGKRRRGNGQCNVTIESIKTDEWITWLGDYLNSESLTLPNIPELAIQSSPPKVGDRSEGNENSWQTIRIEVTALSPIVITKRTVGNVVETLDYIPGTHLLRMVRRQIVKHHPDFAASIDSAIAHNDLVITNATIAIGQTQSYPTPFVLSTEKIGGGLLKGAKIYNRLLDDVTEATQLKAERGGYLTCATNNSILEYPNYQKVDITAETHNIVDDAVQRPTSNTGGVYTYEAIASGTIFQAEVRLRKHLANSIGQTQAHWQKVLGGETAIGQSKKDDYGRVIVEVLDVKAEPSSSSKPKQDIKELTVWLLSDMLLRDDRLRPTNDFEYLKKQLEDRLDIKLKSPDQKIGIARSHRIDSWQVRWQLPRPSLVGLGAGSCIRFEITTGELDSDGLGAIERSGIGERRAEGYGQVCFNHPLLSQSLSGLTYSKASDEDKSQEDPPVNLIPLQRYARIIERAAWQKAIQQKVLARAKDYKTLLYIGIEKDKPTMSQLGALRSVLSQVQNFSDTNQAILWLANIRANKSRSGKWLNQSLEKIGRYLTEANLIWEDLALNLEPITLTDTGEADLKKDLWAEALYALIDACIRAHKRDLEKKQSQDSTQTRTAQEVN
jgi:CRISPR-associated protein Csx10